MYINSSFVLTSCLHSSNVDSVTTIIQLVRQQGRAYFATLDDSISVAVSLHELAQDAKHLARSLLDPDHTPEEIQEFVSEMRSYTREALKKSKRVSEALRNVRRGITEVHTTDVAAESSLLTIDQDHRHHPR